MISQNSKIFLKSFGHFEKKVPNCILRAKKALPVP